MYGMMWEEKQGERTLSDIRPNGTTLILTGEGRGVHGQ